MFKAIRITVLLFILFFVSVSTWLTQARSTDWSDSLWVKIYPINGDGSAASRDYIGRLDLEDFTDIESFIKRESERFGHTIARPVRMELGEQIHEQPPVMSGNPSLLDIMFWSIRMRWWASGITEDQDRIDPDVRIFVRYHTPGDDVVLENSVGLQKGMVGVVNAYASRRLAGSNNVIIAHEFLHTLGATDKYDPATGAPTYPGGYAEPEREPRYPQRYAEIMGGRIPVDADEAEIPGSLKLAIIGDLTASEIRLTD